MKIRINNYCKVLFDNEEYILSEGEYYNLCEDGEYIHTESIYTFPKSVLRKLTENEDYEIVK